MAHVPEHIEEIPVTPPEQDRETLIETFQRNPISGLGKTAQMFMPSWLSGQQQGELSLGDTVKSMIEWTPVVGDIMDLREGTDFQNDLDPLERGLAIFAGLGVGTAAVRTVGPAATKVTSAAYSSMRNRYRNLVREQYEALRPAAAAAQPIDMNYEDVRLEHRAKQRSTGGGRVLSVKERAIADALDVKDTPRWQKIMLADTPRELADALWKNLPQYFDPAKVSDRGDDIGLDPAVRGDLGDREGYANQLPASLNTAAFMAMITDLGSLMIKRGLIEGELGSHTGDSTQMWYADPTDTPEGLLNYNESNVPQDHMDAATLGLSIISQVFEKGLLIDSGPGGQIYDSPYKLLKSLLQPEDMAEFIFAQHATIPNETKGGVWSQQWNEDFGQLLNLIVDVSATVLKFSGPDMALAPHLQWGGFYVDGDGRVQGNLNLHVLPNKRLVDTKNGVLLGSKKDFTKAIYSMDPESLVPQFVLNLLSVAQGETGVSLTPEYRQAAKEWYPKFNKLIHVISEKFGMSPMSVGAAISSLSPQTEWDQNINLGIRAAIEYAMGEVDPKTQLQIVNEVRQEAGYPLVTELNDAQLQQDRWSKAQKALAGENPIKLLRMLKTMSFAHNGLFPEGTAADSAEGVNVITGDIHFMRALMGFFFTLDAPWMAPGREVWVGEKWENLLGKDFADRAAEQGLLSEEEAASGEFWKIEAGEGTVPTEIILRWYEAITKSMVMVSEILGIKPQEAQALLWLPIQELSNGIKNGKTVVWNDSVIRELEGRSVVNPSFIDALDSVDNDLIDPNASHLDVFGYNKTSRFDSQNGVLIASGSKGIRIYADTRLEGVSDLLRTAIPIAAEPRTMLRKKKPIGVLGQESETAAKNDPDFKPLRWVQRKSRKVKDLGVVAKELLSTAPASELRTYTDPSIAEGVPDVYSSGNYIVVEVEPKNIKTVRTILSHQKKPFFQPVEVPMTVESGSKRSDAPLSAHEIMDGLASKRSDNPLISNSWVIVPDTNLKFIGRIRDKRRQGALEPQEIYIKSPDGDSKRAWIIFGADETLEGLESFDVFWTQDAQHNVREGTVIPSEEGTKMSASQNGVTFSLPQDGKGMTDFSVEYDESLTVSNALATDPEGGKRAPSKRVQVIVELGSVPDPDMVLDLWHELNGTDTVESISGYFHGEVWTDDSMTRAGEFVYTNGNQRVVQRAAFNGSHAASNGNHYTVWVPRTEATKLSTHHGSFSPDRESHVFNIQRLTDSTVMVDGEVAVWGLGDGFLEINPEKILDATIDGEMVTEAAFMNDPNNMNQPTIVLGSEGQVEQAVQNAMAHFEHGANPFRIPPIFKLEFTNGQNRIIAVTNDQLEPIQGGRYLAAHRAVTPSEAMAKKTSPQWEMKRQSVKSTGVVDPKEVASVNAVYESIMMMVRLGVPFRGSWKNVIKNHPLADVIASRFTPTKVHNTLYHAADFGPKTTEGELAFTEVAVFWDEVSKGQASEEDVKSFAAFVDGAGRTIMNKNPSDLMALKIKKAESLDPKRQRMYKDWAGENIPDFSLFLQPTPILAGYKLPVTFNAQQRFDELVVKNLAALAALTERPSQQASAEGSIESFRSLPGISWFRNRHDGMVFPGILPLQGMIGIGAGAYSASWGGQATGYFEQTDPYTVTNKPYYFMLDEEGKKVRSHGIHIDAYSILAHNDPDRFIAGALSVYGNEGKVKTLKGLPKSTLRNVFQAFTMIHEYGHAVHAAISELGRGHLFREAVSRIVYKHGGPGTIYQEVSRYAASNYLEFMAESFFEVMTLGPKAHPMAIETVDLMWEVLYTVDTKALEQKYEIRKRDLTGGHDVGGGEFAKSHQLGGPADFHPFWSGTISMWDVEFANVSPSINPIEITQYSPHQIGHKSHEPISRYDDHRSSLFHYLKWLGEGKDALAKKRGAEIFGEVNLSKEDWKALR